MSEGLVRCSGTSLFLKTRFGAGYVLSMAKTASWNNNSNNNNSSAESDTVNKEYLDNENGISNANGDVDALDTSQLQRVQHVVQALVPDAELTSHVAGELIFTLPLTSVPVFGALFQALQQVRQGILFHCALMTNAFIALPY